MNMCSTQIIHIPSRVIVSLQCLMDSKVVATYNSGGCMMTLVCRIQAAAAATAVVVVCLPSNVLSTLDLV